MTIWNLFIFQIGFLGICGKRVDSIEYYEQQIKEIDKRVIHKCYFIWNLLNAAVFLA